MDFYPSPSLRHLPGVKHRGTLRAMILGLDILALVAALAAAVLWFQASGRNLRRVSYKEEIDATDINRIITTINRAQILNARAALATAVSALALGARLAIDLFLRS